MSTRRITLLSIATAGLFALSACGGGSSTTTSTPASEAKTVTNCGVELKIEKTPTKVISLEQGASDTLAMMGLEKNVLGITNLKDKAPAGYEAAYDAMPVLNQEMPSGEQLRDADPDFIYSTLPSLYTKQYAGERSEWQDLKVNTFLSNVTCQDQPENQGKDMYGMIENDLTQLGQIFDKEDRAKELIDQQRQKIEEAQELKDQIPEGASVAMVYSYFKDIPYVGGKTSIQQDAADIMGVKNIFDDMNEDYGETSWEALADRNPDVLVLVDITERGLQGDTAKEKIELMKKDPATKHLKALQENRIVTVRAGATTGSASAVDVIDAMKEAAEKGYFGTK